MQVVLQRLEGYYPLWEVGPDVPQWSENIDPATLPLTAAALEQVFNYGKRQPGYLVGSVVSYEDWHEAQHQETRTLREELRRQLAPEIDVLESWYFGFRDLYEDLIHATPERFVALLRDPLTIASCRASLLPLLHYQEQNSDDNPYGVRDDDLFDLYALGRVCDLLSIAVHAGALSPDEETLLFSALPEETWTRDRLQRWSEQGIPRLMREQYSAFFGAIGLTVFDDRPYSPFHYEVVELVETDTDEVVVEQVMWPGVMFGALLVLRAGARVLCPRGLLDRVCAEQSTLYWSYLRLLRDTYDLSVGWGSNSQWGTRFRRDYDTSGSYHFNVDGEYDLASPQGERQAHRLVRELAGVPLNIRREWAKRLREVLVYRSLVRLPAPDGIVGDHTRHWWAGRLTVPKNGTSWPI